jgi:hypothetical protein
MNNQEPPSSPWGQIQLTTIFDDQAGVYFVSTSSHGGLMIRREIALEKLSPEAIAEGFRWKDFVCYEEDSAWTVAAWEMEFLWDTLFKYSSEEIQEDPKTYLRETIFYSHKTYWNQKIKD